METQPSERRVAGLMVLGLIVLVGMGMPVYYRYKVGDLNRERDRILAEAPSEPEARAALWFSMMEPNLLNVLDKCRFSSRQPYLVSHVVQARTADEPPEVWGVHSDVVERGVSVVLDGLVVRVVLPAPEIVARDVLVGDQAYGVPQFHPDNLPEDPRVLLRNRVEFVLKRHMATLQKQVQGSGISVEVGGLVREWARKVPAGEAPRPVDAPSNDSKTGTGN